MPKHHEDLADGLMVHHARWLIGSNLMQDVFLDDFLIPLRRCSRVLCQLVTDAFDDMKAMPRTIEAPPWLSQVCALQLVICDLSIVVFNLQLFLRRGWGETLTWLTGDVRIELNLAELRLEYPQQLRDLVHLGQADTSTWRLLRILIRSYWDDDAYDHILSERARRSIQARLGLSGNL